MPLVDVHVSLDAHGGRWGTFVMIPVHVTLTIDGRQLTAAPMKVESVRAFIKFLDACSDASFRQTSLLMEGLAENSHSAECRGMFLEQSTLESFVEGVIKIVPVRPCVIRGWYPPA